MRFGINLTRRVRSTAEPLLRLPSRAAITAKTAAVTIITRAAKASIRSYSSKVTVSSYSSRVSL